MRLRAWAVSTDSSVIYPQSKSQDQSLCWSLYTHSLVALTVLKILCMCLWYVCYGQCTVYSECGTNICKCTKHVLYGCCRPWSACLVHCFSTPLMRSECFVSILTATVSVKSLLLMITSNIDHLSTSVIVKKFNCICSAWLLFVWCVWQRVNAANCQKDGCS